MAILRLKETYIASDGSYWGGYWSRRRIAKASHIPMDLIYDLQSVSDQGPPKLAKKQREGHGPQLLSFFPKGKETYSKAFRRTVELFVRGWS
jgi:hypothetical protein